MKDKTILKYQIFYFFLIGSVGCFMPYINVYLENSIGLTGSQIGLLTALSLVIGVCVVPLWGIVGDKTRQYRGLLIFSLVATIIVLYCYSKSTVYIGVMFFALLLEVARLGANPMADTLAMDYTTKHNGNYGSIRSMGSLGYMLASMAVGFLADMFGLDGPLFTCYILLLGAALLICLTLPKQETTEEEKETPNNKHFIDLLKNKKFLFILIITMLTTAVVDSVGTYAGNHIVTTLGGDNSLISWLTMIQVLPEVIFLAVALKVIHKTGYKKFYLIAVILMAIRMAVSAVVPSAYVFLVVSVVHCLGVACYTVGNLAFIKHSISPAVFGTAITLMNASMSIAKAFYGYIFGFIYQHLGSYQMYLIAAVFVVIACVLVFTTKQFNDIDQSLIENAKSES